MIRRIELENWRSHEHSVLEFSEGTNVLVGIIGSGKSSVMNALCYALFGTFPELQQRRLKLDDVIMSRPYEKKRARVLVQFTLGNEEYVVERVIEKGKGSTESFLRRNGSLVEGPNARRVTEKVSEVLGMGYELFSKAVYSEQNNLEYFLEIPRGQRKQKLDELLGITRMEAARKNSAKARRQLAARTSMLETEAARAPSEEEVGKKGAEVDALAQRIGRLESERKRCEERVRSARERLDRAEENRREHDRLRRELEKGRGLEEALSRKAVGTARDIRAVTLELERVREEMRAAREAEEARKKAEAMLAEKKGFLKSLEADREKIVRELDGLPDPGRVSEQLSGTVEELVSLKSRVEASRSREDRIRQELSMLEGREECPLCGSALTEEHASRIVSEKQGELGRILRERAECLERMRALENEKRVLESKKEKTSRKGYLEARLEKIGLEVKKTAEEVEKLEQELGSIKAQDTSALFEKERRLLREKEAAEAAAELEKARQEMAEVSARISALAYDPKECDRAAAELNAATAEHARVSQALAGEKRLLKEKQEHLDTLLREVEKARKAREEADSLKRAITRLGLLEKVLAAGQDELRREFVAETNLALQEVWQRIYPYGDYVGLKLDVEEGDYVLRLRTARGNYVNVEGVTSGGERSAASLALRIALSFVLAKNLSWLVLDEPTHNLDRNTVKELAVMLRERLPRIVEQVFIITHDEELEAAASGTLYVLDRDKQENEPTRVKREALQDLLF